MNHSIIPQKPEDAFPLIGHFIFAIVIASSYDLAARVFLSPEDPVYSGLDPFLVALELTVAYVSIISGWLGYARSVHKWPHRDTKFGMLRFITDIAILFCYFGLIEAADPARDVFRDQFMAWICAIFVLYFFSDVFKRQDHKSKTHKDRNRRLNWSLSLTLIFLGISAALYAFNAHVRGLWGTNDGALYMMILMSAIAILLLYRLPKWKVHTKPGRSSSRRPGRKPSSGGSQAKAKARARSDGQ